MVRDSLNDMAQWPPTTWLDELLDRLADAMAVVVVFAIRKVMRLP